VDEQGAPTKGDREGLVERINRVAAAGRISTADRDIRLGNVASAQSRTELDLMSRDLDQLEASMPATPAATPYAAFDPDAAASPFSGASVAVTGSRRTWIVTAVIAGVSLLLAGGLGLLSLIGHAVSGSDSGSDSGSAPTLPPAQTDGASPTDVDDPSAGASPGPLAPGSYSLTARGITGFLATYAKKFGTPRAVELVLYPDYAVVDVPVAGGRGRQAGWLYRKDSGWTTFGGVRAVFPGSSTIETRTLGVAALVRNIARARTTLKVEGPSQTYVIVRYIHGVDDVPSVDIHVANGFNESGYLATRLDGTVERAYPYGE
jgi:hypothetical protein